jgi:hypothetical protein
MNRDQAMKSPKKQTSHTKPEPSATELLDQIQALARTLKAIEPRHGATILFAVQEVRDRMNGKDL